ncbi:TadE/TadG family type IV pilus assembly protein [Yinghuangia sp. ASG 101]|uniref:TadE/TadG family type IV pilus assembly protein n=1 Tax=Yinghuangia sp. ASG 101 TaxID=2896848 RepID=UPI002F916E97
MTPRGRVVAGPARTRPPTRGGRARLAGAVRDERGSATVELVLLVPLLVLILLFVVAVGRFASARGLVDDAAHQAARAASLTRNATAAEQAAYDAAHAALAGAGVTCTSLAVTVDTKAFTPGGRVRVAVSCTVSLAEMSALGLPGHRTLHGEASSILDEHRGTR